MLSILLPEIWDTVFNRFCFLSGILTIYLDVILLLVFCVSSSLCCGVALQYVTVVFSFTIHVQFYCHLQRSCKYLPHMPYTLKLHINFDLHAKCF